LSALQPEVLKRFPFSLPAHNVTLRDDEWLKERPRLAERVIKNLQDGLLTSGFNEGKSMEQARQISSSPPVLMQLESYIVERVAGRLHFELSRELKEISKYKDNDSNYSNQEPCQRCEHSVATEFFSINRTLDCHICAAS